MRKLINLACVTVFCLVGVNTAFAQQGAQPNIKIQHWETQNKVGVYFVERDQIPMLDISVVFKAGSAYDQEKFGLAAFCNSMLGEGTTTKTAQQIATEFDSLGAQLGASTNQDMAVVSLRTLTESKYLTPALEAAIDVLTQANFPEKAFLRVKQQIFDELRHDQQEPNVVAAQAFFKALYGNQPYGHPVDGTLATVSKITRDDIIHFYKTFYVDKNAKIILVGKLTEVEAHQISDKIAVKIRPGVASKSLQNTKQVTQGKKIFVSMPIAQNTILIGENGIRRQNKDYFNLLVANHVLGGPVMTTILFEKVRNQKGLAYGVYSRFSPLAAKGPYSIWLQTRYTKSTEAINLVDSILRQYVQVGPTQSELDAAKLNILGAFPILISTNSSILGNVASIAFYDLPLDYLNTYPRNIKAVTKQSAKAAFAKQIKLDALNTIIVGRKT